MGETRDDVYEEELVDYEEEEEKAPDSAAKVNGEAPKKGYVGIHSSGFRDFLLKPELLRAIVDSGFEHPSEVQHECIPQAILGMDVICQAKSGMGKTAVFVLSTLQQIDPVAGQVSALVLCHTRELAYQICHEFERFSTYLPDLKVAVFYGGVNIKLHKDLLKNECPHIVVGTPGRILALARDKDLSLKNVRHFILDECDKMLESLDMRRDVQEIFKMTPHDKQVMMFSATLSKEIRPVCKKFMQDPMEIYVDDEAKLTLHGLVQHYIKLTEAEKNRKLNDLLDALDFNQVVIFVKSVSRAAELNKLLSECNFPSICIHSGMNQEERLKRYKGFKEGHNRILVATDLVGRGIDIERVNIVINYDMPDSADTYLHRVGRAGRFGTKGLAITFVSSAADSDVLNDVQERFEVDIKELPEQIDTATYSMFSCWVQSLFCALHLHNCPNLQLRGLTHVNSSKGHIGISYSQNVTLSHLNINAPESSPNTDGIDLYSATNVSIHQSTITTGNLIYLPLNYRVFFFFYLNNFLPWEALEQVEHMKQLKKCLWEVVLLKGLYQGSLSLSNVTYTGVRGTSAVQNAITLNCAASTNCTNIRMSHVNITSWASGTHQVSANGTSSCTTPAVPCLHHYIEKMKILYFNQNAYGD
ncbi:hypothetical protein GBA52_000274 [Prunus armeniaca]|nr:hypothetical protein GBA52_000274 [Prunus armeniaca]